MTFGGIILCGGQSQRMGLDKASLPFGDETMLARVARRLFQVVSPIVVVAARNQSLPEIGVPYVVAHDARESQGPLEGLAAGMAALENEVDAVYATSCDVPLLEPDFVRRMTQLLGEHEIVVPKEEKFYHPLAAVYRTSVLVKIECLLDHGRLRPRFLFDGCDTREVEVEKLREVDAELNTLMNLNRPEDYLRVAKLAGVEVPPDVVSVLGIDGEINGS